MALAGELAAALEGKGEIARVSVAAPGLRQPDHAPGFWQRQVRAVLAAGRDYGRSEIGARPPRQCRVLLGQPDRAAACRPRPRHRVRRRAGGRAGHAGFAVTREYYVNDGGAQTETLARSLHLRYREALGEAIEIPSGLYPGDYLKPVAAEIAGRDGDRWLAGGEADWLEPFTRMGVDGDAGADPRRPRGAGRARTTCSPPSAG